MSERDSTSFFEGSRTVTDLTPSDFDDMRVWKLKNHKCSMVLFYCAWCPHCQAAREVWEKLGEVAVYADVCGMNCEKYKTHISKIKEEMAGLVQGYPTIVIYRYGEPVEVYKSPDRSLNALVEVSKRLCLPKDK